MKVRLVQIGLGDWGVNWATGVVPQISDVEVVGYVVRSQESAAIARVRLGDSVTPFFLSLEEAVEKTAPDGVLILTTTEAHVDLVSRALTLGCHVLVEKPFVPTVAEGRILVQMAENRGLILMVNQNFRFFPAAQRAADLVREGKLGEVAAISIAFRRMITYENETRKSWHHELRDPIIADLAIHHFDLMRMVLGHEPVSVFCSAPRPPGVSSMIPVRQPRSWFSRAA